MTLNKGQTCIMVCVLVHMYAKDWCWLCI